MAKLTDQTDVGGKMGKFQTTRWSEIDRAKTPDPDQRRLIIDHLVRLYWKPVYCYLRQRGCQNERAKDLTQGFFQEIVLGQDLIRYADQCRGRFRSFLLTALDHYVSNQFRKERAAVRALDNRAKGVSLETLPDLPIAARGADPAKAFDYAWAVTLLDDVLEEVERFFIETDRAAYWELFRERVLLPVMENAKSTPMPELCARYGIANESKASNMIVTVKRRFRAVLDERLRRFVDDDSSVEVERLELIELLSKGSSVRWVDS